jgi:hypothetical protein
MNFIQMALKPFLHTCLFSAGIGNITLTNMGKKFEKVKSKNNQKPFNLTIGQIYIIYYKTVF